MSPRTDARATGEDEPGPDEPRRDEPDDDTFDVGPGGDPRHPDQPEIPNPPPPDDTTPDDATVEALGLLSEAVEWIERARGRLYDFHQLTGHADEVLGQAADALDAAGHDAWGRTIREELVGRNVIEGRWTFQVVEEYDDTYWGVVRAVRTAAEHALADGRRHVHEARLKDARRSHGRRHHEALPPELAGPAVAPG